MDQNIKIIEKALDLKLSDEQLAILESHFKNPTLVNACAGAGKTTTMIISILYQAMCHETQPENVLAITFSHAAKEDMAEKYTKLKTQLATIYPEASGWQDPRFSTFHALFFKLLKDLYPDYPFNVTSWSQYAQDLYHEIHHPKEVLTHYENVKSLMEESEWLINHGYTYDGLIVNHNLKDVQTIIKNLKQPEQNDLEALLNYIGISDPDHINDYIRIINRYHEIKNAHSEIDFNDMQSMLLNALQEDPTRITQIQALLSNRLGVKQVYLDEFQDISPIQWTLMHYVINQETQNHLVAIGDDDQSIYRFRGSDPYFILNFDKKLNNAKKFNLSTNYRTSENILNVAKPMIESNKLRLVKSLKAYNPGGKVVQAIRQGPEEDPGLDEFIQDIKDHPERSYAVFARNNSSLSIVTDIMAESGLYADFDGNNQYIFQNTKIYRIYFNLMHAVYTDDFEQFVKSSNRIGFSKMRNFLSNYQTSYQSLSSFLLNSTWLHDLQQVINGYKNPRAAYSEKQNLSTLLTIQQNVKQIQEYRNSKDSVTAKYLPIVIFNFIDQVTQPYFKFMMKKHYLGIPNYEFQNVHEYFKNLIRQAPSCEGFFIKEQTKQNEMAAGDHKIKISAMTFHRSKGLEFDETLLFTTKDGPISRVNYMLNEFFPANDTIDKTTKRIIDNPTMSLALMDANDLESMTRIRRLFFSHDPEALLRFNNLMQQIESSNFEYLPEIKIKSDKLKADQNLQRLIFLEINGISKNVEEEKRLLYVAVTRAKHKAIFDQAPENDIITSQLHFKSQEANDVHFSNNWPNVTDTARKRL